MALRRIKRRDGPKIDVGYLQQNGKN